MGVDVEIHAPVAIGGLKVPSPSSVLDPPTLEELYRAEVADNARLRRDMRHLGDTASAISSVCLGLMRMLGDAGLAEGNTVRVPRLLHQQMIGASIKLGDDQAGNITVTLIERSRERVTVD